MEMKMSIDWRRVRAIPFMLTICYLMGCSRHAAEPRINWFTDVDSALQAATRSDRPLMIEFMATWCPSCRAMEDSTLTDGAVIERSRAFVPVRIDVDKQPEIANRYRGNARKYGGIGIPNILFITAQEDTLFRLIGYYPAARLTTVMDSILALYEQQKK